MVPSERSSPRPAPHVQVRKLAPRSAPRAEYTDSGSAAWRGVELRLIAFVAFVVLSIGGLAVRKALVLLGGWTVVVAFGVVTGLLIVATYFLRRRRRERMREGDVEHTLEPSIVEAQLLEGALSPADLVHEQGVWTTLLDSVQFGDVAAVVDARAQRRSRFVMGIAITVGVLVGLAIFSGYFTSVLSWLLGD